MPLFRVHDGDEPMADPPPSSPKSSSRWPSMQSFSFSSGRHNRFDDDETQISDSASTPKLSPKWPSMQSLSFSSGKRGKSLRDLMSSNQLSVKSLLSHMSADSLNNVIIPRVQFEDRAWRVAKFDYCFAALFLIGFIAHIACGAKIIHSQNSFSNATGTYITLALKAEYDACLVALADLQNTSTSGRRLLPFTEFTEAGPSLGDVFPNYEYVNSNLLDNYHRSSLLRFLQTSALDEDGTNPVDDCTTLWCVIGETPRVTVATFIGAVLIGVCWLASMRWKPQYSAWFAALWSPVMYVSVAIALITRTEGTTMLSALFFATAVILVFVLAAAHESIKATGEHLRIAAAVLLQNAYMFRAIAVVLVVLCIFLAWHWSVTMRSVDIIEFTVAASCEPTTPAYVESMLIYLFLFMVWFISFCNSQKLVIVSMCVGSWFLQQPIRPRLPDFSALRAGYSTSFGTIAGGCLVTEFVDYIVERGGSNFWWLDPLGYIIRPLKFAFGRCVTPFTRFSMIAHAFTGEGFGPAAYRSAKLLRRNFTNAYVADRILIAGVRTGTNAFSIALGLVVWARIDAINGWNSLRNSPNGDGVFGGVPGLLLFVCLASYLTRRPLLGLMMLALVNDTLLAWLNGTVQLFAPMAGVFVACLASVIIGFQGDCVLNTIDTIFMCYAIVEDTGMSTPVDGTREDAHLYADSMPATINPDQPHGQQQRQQQRPSQGGRPSRGARSRESQTDDEGESGSQDSTSNPRAKESFHSH